MTTVQSLGLFRGIQYDLVYGTVADNNAFTWNEAVADATSREHNYGNCEIAKGKLAEILDEDLNDFITSKINSSVTPPGLANGQLIFVNGRNYGATGCWVWDCSKNLIHTGTAAAPTAVGSYRNFVQAMPQVEPNPAYEYIAYIIGANSGITKWTTVDDTGVKNGRGYIVCYPRGLVKGEVILGTCDPLDDAGKFGDVYINKTTCVIFGPKTCTWGCGTKLTYNIPSGCLCKKCSNDFNDSRAPLCGSGKDCECPCDAHEEGKQEVDCYYGKNNCKGYGPGCNNGGSGSGSGSCCGKKVYSLFSINWGGKGGCQ